MGVFKDEEDGAGPACDEVSVGVAEGAGVDVVGGGGSARGSRGADAGALA